MISFTHEKERKLERVANTIQLYKIDILYNLGDYKSLYIRLFLILSRFYLITDFSLGLIPILLLIKFFRDNFRRLYIINSNHTYKLTLLKFKFTECKLYWLYRLYSINLAS